MSETVRFIGIDFGTSTSVVSYMDYEKEGDLLVSKNNLQSVAHPSDLTLIPTIIKLADTQASELCGHDVLDYYIEHYPYLIEKEFKMRLGSSATKEERAKAIELTYKFFEYLYQYYAEFEKANKAHNAAIAERRVYVSFPAKWDTEQKSITVDAAYEAFKKFPGVRVSGINRIDEPTAALLYCISHQDINAKAKDELRTINKSSFILLIDMGAGTTDLIVYEYIPDKPIKVLAKYPEPGKESVTFGGREIDKIFERHFEAEYNYKPENTVDFSRDCERWKIEVSKLLNSFKSESEPVPFLPTLMRGRSYSSSGYDKRRICWLLKDYLPQFPELVNSTLEIAKSNSPEFLKNGAEVDLVVLTGGHSQWFFIKDMIKGKWVPGLPGNENLGSGINLSKIRSDDWRLIATKYPQHIVSYGLCMSGIPIKIRQLSNCDVWLDIQLGDSDSQKERIIKRNTELPYQTVFYKKFRCRIGREVKNISAIITPILGVKGDDYLDPVKEDVLTNDFRDFVVALGENKYRYENVEIHLTCKFDKNQIFSFEGKIITPGVFGYEKSIAMTPTQIADKIRRSS